MVSVVSGGIQGELDGEEESDTSVVPLGPPCELGCECSADRIGQ